MFFTMFKVADNESTSIWIQEWLRVDRIGLLNIRCCSMGGICRQAKDYSCMNQGGRRGIEMDQKSNRRWLLSQAWMQGVI
jgi:hypothetical protein